MKFKDDKPVECEYCGKMIYPGDCVLEWNKSDYCSEECVKNAMFETFFVKTRYILTAEEKEAVYGDMQYDEMRGK